MATFAARTLVEVYMRGGALWTLALCLLGCQSEKPEKAEIRSAAAVGATPPSAVLPTFGDSAASLPAGLEIAGRLWRTMAWTDAEGEHLVALSRRDAVRDSSLRHDTEEGLDADLYAAHYVRRGAWTKVWALHDMVRDCDFDIVADFVPSSLAVTDLDHNGQSEVWLAYGVDCVSDVSPTTLKLMAYQGTTKMAMRGQSRVNPGDGFVGGQKTADAAFQAAPKVMLAFADSLWQSILQKPSGE